MKTGTLQPSPRIVRFPTHRRTLSPFITDGKPCSVYTIREADEVIRKALSRFMGRRDGSINQGA